jgi:hypothetical protein
MSVTSNSFNRITFACVLGLALVTVSCGKVARTGRGPAPVVVTKLEAASGAEPDKMGGVLFSDVVTNVTRTVNGQQVQTPTLFADLAQITMTLVLKDPGQPGVPSSPSALNQVTFSRYRVNYRRADGRNTPGVDVPYGFDSGIGFTVPPDGTITASFELVRHVAKQEAPLSALAASGVIITTIAEVSFFGADQAGNEVIATANIGVEFGNFGDPQ